MWERFPLPGERREAPNTSFVDRFFKGDSSKALWRTQIANRVVNMNDVTGEELVTFLRDEDLPRGRDDTLKYGRLYAIMKREGFQKKAIRRGGKQFKSFVRTSA